MITICAECKQYSCPSACPEYSGELHAELGRRVAKCFACECNVFELEKAYFFSDRAMCSECAKHTVQDDLLSFVRLKNIDELMLELGANIQNQGLCP